MTFINLDLINLSAPQLYVHSAHFYLLTSISFFSQLYYFYYFLTFFCFISATASACCKYSGIALTSQIFSIISSGKHKTNFCYISSESVSFLNQVFATHNFFSWQSSSNISPSIFLSPKPLSQ